MFRNKIKQTLINRLKFYTQDLRVYRGRVSFLPVDPNFTFKNKNIVIQTNKRNYKETQNLTRLHNEQLNMTYRYLKPIHHPVPNDWVTIEDNFVLFLLLNLPLMGVEFLIDPEKRIDDDYLGICFVREGITKLELIKFIYQSSQGVILKNPYMEYVRVRAFRLEPLDLSRGSLMVDGESISYGSIQGEVLPRLGQVFARYPSK